MCPRTPFGPRIAAACSTVLLSLLASQALATPLGSTCSTAPTVTAGAHAFDLAGETPHETPQGFCAFPTPTFDKWAKYVASSSGVVSISIPTATDAVSIAVYDVACGTEFAFPIKCVKTGDCPAGVSTKVPVEAGAVLYVQVTGIGEGTPAGDLVIQELVPGPGDTCATAIAANLGVNAYNTAASINNDNFGNTSPIDDVWFVFTPAVSGGLTASLCGQPQQGSDGVSLYQACEETGILDRGNYPDEGDNYILPPCRAQAKVTAGQPVYIRMVQACPGPAQFTLTLDPLLVPTNDTCAGALTVVEGETPFNNTFAGTDAAEPCLQGGISFGGGKDLFFAFTPQFTADYELANIASVSPAIDSTTMAVYLQCGDEGIVNCANTGFAAWFRVQLSAGQRYIIRVAGAGRLIDGTPFSRGNGILKIRRVVPPANDLCANATVIGAGTHAFDLRDAGADGTPWCPEAFPASDVWFTYTPASSGVQEIGLVQGEVVQSAEITLSTACGSVPYAVSGNEVDLMTGNYVSRLIFQATAGQPIRIRVAGTIPYPLLGTGQLYVGAVRSPAPPANDSCDRPAVLAEGVTTPFTVANALISPPPCYADSNCQTDACTTAILGDVFYIYTATSTGSKTLYINDGEPYYNGVTYAAGATAAILPACGEQPTACALACGDFPKDSLTFDVTAGQSYLIRIGNYVGAPWASLGGTIRIGQPCNSIADVAGPNQSQIADGQLTADDIIVFLGWYFAGNPRGDVAGPNQSTEPDQTFTADDIIVFLGRFFAGC